MQTNKLFRWFLVMVAGLTLLSTARADEHHDKMIQVLRETMAGWSAQVPVPASAAEYEEMFRALRQAIAQVRCTECCGKHSVADMKHCQEKCACLDHSICPQPGAPLAAPAPTTKEGRLAALLQEYRAGRITPTQYHEQRAQIVTQP